MKTLRRRLINKKKIFTQTRKISKFVRVYGNEVRINKPRKFIEKYGECPLYLITKINHSQDKINTCISSIQRTYSDTFSSQNVRDRDALNLFLYLCSELYEIFDANPNLLGEVNKFLKKSDQIKRLRDIYRAIDGRVLHYIRNNAGFHNGDENHLRKNILNITKFNTPLKLFKFSKNNF